MLAGSLCFVNSIDLAGCPYIILASVFTQLVLTVPCCIKVSFVLVAILPSLTKVAQDTATESLDDLNNKHVLRCLEICELFMQILISS